MNPGNNPPSFSEKSPASFAAGFIFFLLLSVGPTGTSATVTGLLISGGDNAGQLVEVYAPSTGQQCRISDLPDPARFHTMEAKTICGGKYTKTSCVTLTSAGTWEKTTDLLEERYYHSSWASPSGLILLGGESSLTTTEKIQPGGTSTASFTLQHSTDSACAINLGSSVILTGGLYTLTTVSLYNEAGWVRDLPELQQRRRGHGCSSYNNAEGTKTLLVSGGDTGSDGSDFDFHSSTELLVEGSSAWINGDSLPSPRADLRGANIDNKVFMTGGHFCADSDCTFFDDILEFDPLTEKWKEVAKMMKKRDEHALSTIQFESRLCKSEPSNSGSFLSGSGLLFLSGLMAKWFI